MGELAPDQLDELGFDLTEERARLAALLKSSKDDAKPVRYRRLKARPETPFCLECPDAREA